MPMCMCLCAPIPAEKPRKFGWSEKTSAETIEVGRPVWLHRRDDIPVYMHACVHAYMHVRPSRWAAPCGSIGATTYLCICMRVCMRICMYVCARVHVHVHAYAYMHVYMHRKRRGAAAALPRATSQSGAACM